MKLLIKNGRVVDPRSDTDDTLDILIEDGTIRSVDKRIRDAKAEVFDAVGCVVAPGFIDMHVHLREPGFERKETIATGMAAALAGGFTGVACMPNTDPVNDNGSVTRFILDRAELAGPGSVYPIGAITKGSKGEELALYAEMKEAGIRALSDDGMPVRDSGVMRRAMEYAASLDLPIIDHAEEPALTGSGVVNEGEASVRMGVGGIPAEAEAVAVYRDLLLAGLTNARVHIAHVSTRLSVEAIRWAKSRGVRVTAEATPHHFSLTESEVLSYDTNAKMSPPLRSADDVKAVVGGIADGTLDVIASDHAPHTYEEKVQPFDLAPNGIIGLQTAVPLALDRLVRHSKIPVMRVVEALSTKPAAILGLEDKGSIAPGADGDLTIFSLRKKSCLKYEDIKSLGKNSPFIDRKLQGCVECAVIAGVLYPVD